MEVPLNFFFKKFPLVPAVLRPGRAKGVKTAPAHLKVATEKGHWYFS